MKTLQLTLKKQWFDMIASGQKREEYRDIKPYWDVRLNKKYTHVRFRNGYHSNAPEMTFKVRKITKGLGVSVWGAKKGVEYYRVCLGDRAA